MHTRPTRVDNKKTITRRRPPAPPSPANLATIIAADLEEAMLYSCLSNEDVAAAAAAATLGKPTRMTSSFSTRSRSRKIHDLAKDTSHMDDDIIKFDNANHNNGIEIGPSGLTQLSTDSSFSSFDSSDSDISLCPPDHHHHKHHHRHHKPKKTSCSPTKKVISNNSHTRRLDDRSRTSNNHDGDCSISAVSSFANLFLGQGSPCTSHLETNDSVLNQQRHRRRSTAFNAATTTCTATSSSSSRTKAMPKLSTREARKRLEIFADKENSTNSIIHSIATVVTTSSTSSSSDAQHPARLPLKPKQSILKKPSSRRKKVPTVTSVGTTTSLDNSDITKATTATTTATTTTTTSSSSSITGTSSKARRVKFDQISFREYKISLSQNPCSDGPPIELGWAFWEPKTMKVEDYEESRHNQRRRRLQELLLSDRDRRRMLIEFGGYSPAQVKEGIRKVEHIKRQRVMTYMMLPLSPLDEAAEDLLHYVTSSINSLVR